MALKVAIQMDPVSGINPRGDTSFLMALNAQARGHKLWTYQPDRLALEGNRVTARGRSLEVREGETPAVREGNLEVLELAEFDVEDCFLNTPRQMIMEALNFWQSYQFRRA